MNAGERTSSATPDASRQRMQAVWSERARRLAQRPISSGAGQNTWPIIVLGLGNERYGIAVADVAEVLPQLRVTPVPGTAGMFAGVINVHGEIRPVIDLRRWLGIETVREGERARVVLLRHEGRELGLQIDSVEQIRSIGVADLQTSANWDQTLSGHIKGSTKDLLMLISTGALFAELETGATT